MQRQTRKRIAMAPYSNVITAS